MMRLNEHSGRKVFGMLLNKHQVPGRVSRIRCHQRHLIYIQPHVSRQCLNLPCSSLIPHLLALKSFVTVELAKENSDPPWYGSHAINATKKSVLIPVTSQLFFQSFAESLSEAIHEIFMLWHGGGTVNVYIAKLQVRIRLHCPSRPGLHYAH